MKANQIRFKTWHNKCWITAVYNDEFSSDNELHNR